MTADEARAKAEELIAKITELKPSTPGWPIHYHVLSPEGRISLLTRALLLAQAEALQERDLVSRPFRPNPDVCCERCCFGRGPHSEWCEKRAVAQPKPTVPELVPLIRAYYAKPGNSVGGNLHIILDEPNYHDDHVRFCLKDAEDRGDEDGANIARLMLRMSKTQRRKLSSMDFYPWSQ